MKLIWSEGAQSDWNDIARYIAAQFGTKALKNFDAATDQAEAQIIAYPGSGTPQKSRKNKQLGLRFVLISKLSKMIYHVDGDTIIVDVIWDTRQSPRRLAGRLAKL